MNAKRAFGVLGFYVLKQNEIGVKLTLGKYSGVASPGLGYAFPGFQKVYKTVFSLQTIDLPDQQIVLSGDIIAHCPGCDTVYNVAEIIGNEGYDDDPDAPGQQVNCHACKAVFTLPRIRKNA